VKQSQAFTAAMNAAGFPCAHTDGSTDEDTRTQQIHALENRSIKCLSSVGVYVEGADVPCVSAVLFARPTRSQTVFTQIVGRAVRLFPDKQDCLLVDLTVRDTKALDKGSLVGKQRECAGCQCHYYTAFKACPNCGMVYVPPAVPQKECPDCGLLVGLPTRECPDCGYNFTSKFSFKDNALYLGGQLFTEKGSLFDELVRQRQGQPFFAAWHRDERGYLTSQLGIEEGSYAITPPDTSGLHHLVFLPTGKYARPESITSDSDVNALILYADVLIAKKGKPNVAAVASWRSQPPSPAQVQLAKSLGVKMAGNENKGWVSAAITHELVIKRLKECQL
jgi:hypothetical protein